MSAVKKVRFETQYDDIFVGYLIPFTDEQIEAWNKKQENDDYQIESGFQIAVGFSNRNGISASVLYDITVEGYGYGYGEFVDWVWEEVTGNEKYAPVSTLKSLIKDQGLEPFISDLDFQSLVNEKLFSIF